MHRLTGLAQFEGTWRLERHIEDLKGGAQGRLQGRAQFTPQEDGSLAYAEQGELSYGGAPAMATERRYIWRSGAGCIEVLFEDGRPFHVLKLGRLMPDASHHCDPDMYHVNYDFTGWPDWRANWRVVGPKKDYRMVSRYMRAGA